MARERQARLRFSRDLSTPIVRRWAPPLKATILGASPSDWEEAREAEDARVRGEVSRKLQMLMTHFNIDPHTEGCWRELSEALARAFVAGFRVTADPFKRGRKPGTGIDRTDLVKKVDQLRSLDSGLKTKLTVAAVTAKLKRHDPAFRTASAESLRVIYEREKKSLRIIDEREKKRWSLSPQGADLTLLGGLAEVSECKE